MDSVCLVQPLWKRVGVEHDIVGGLRVEGACQAAGRRYRRRTYHDVAHSQYWHEMDHHAAVVAHWHALCVVDNFVRCIGIRRPGPHPIRLVCH